MPGHRPVLLHEVVDLLDPRPGGRYLDATFGAGGHARALLERAPDAHVTSVDRDPAAANRADELAAAFPGRFQFYDMDFRDLAELEAECFDGILFDLGVSSFHFDEAGRGFSFRFDAPCDMRMDPRRGISAAEFLEGASEEELVRAVRDFGEERRWRRVVSAILRARGTGALQRTGSFAEVVERALGSAPARRMVRIHPATHTFQGIRMAVNDELGALEAGATAGFDKLAPGGVLAIISFHSLEDRWVKRAFRRYCGQPEHAEDSTPVQERRAVAKMLTPRPVTPAPDEISENPRARSAKLRAVRKLPASP